MESTPLEHSDSDSGESWIVVEEPEPTNSLNLPVLIASKERTSGNDAAKEMINEYSEKDEDTDDVSVISDSEPESMTYFDEVQNNECVVRRNSSEAEENHFIPIDPVSLNYTENCNYSSIRSEEVFVGDNSKFKTYVHKRNKRLSTVLNIIVLGSVITTAGIAIGHMWGVKDECAMRNIPSVNKILSNLYKLQEENAFLRKVIKELMQDENINLSFQANLDMAKNLRCREVFEELRTTDNSHKFTKFVDNGRKGNIDKLEHYMKPFNYEKEYLFDRFKHSYKENKSWLDEEIINYMEYDKLLKCYKINNIDSNNLNKKSSVHSIKLNDTDYKIQASIQTITDDESVTNKLSKINRLIDNKYTYADSLKKNKQNAKKFDIEINNENSKHTEFPSKKKTKDNYSKLPYSSGSDEHFKKNDRYVKYKPKLHSKKQDRNKLHKKQKRINKREYQEIIRDYYMNLDKVLTEEKKPEYENSYKNHKSENSELDRVSVPYANEEKINLNEKTGINKVENQTNDDDGTWYEKRNVLRKEARKNNEKELFGDKIKQHGKKLDMEINNENSKHSEFTSKKKTKDSNSRLPYSSGSDEQFKKNDRYVKYKPRWHSKKQDRNKLHKKQKRINKREYQEIIRDYYMNLDKVLTEEKKPEYENSYKNHKSENSELDRVSVPYANEEKINLNEKTGINKVENQTNDDDGTWYEKRNVLRKEARKNNEKELFGDKIKQHGKKLDMEINNENSKHSEFTSKKKTKDSNSRLPYSSGSDEQFKKNDRYVKYKPRWHSKKQDRNKLHKKQKRINEREYQEMLRDFYMKLYKVLSDLTEEKKPKFENSYKNHNSENSELDRVSVPYTDEEKINLNENTEINKIENQTNDDDGTWYEKRNVLRKEARKNNEKELFGDKIKEHGKKLDMEINNENSKHSEFTSKKKTKEQ